MMDGHLSCVSVAKHPIKLVDDNTQTVHSAHYRARPKTRRLQKIEIGRILKGDVVELAQTE